MPSQAIRATPASAPDAEAMAIGPQPAQHHAIGSEVTQFLATQLETAALAMVSDQEERTSLGLEQEVKSTILRQTQVMRWIEIKRIQERVR